MALVLCVSVGCFLRTEVYTPAVWVNKHMDLTALSLPWPSPASLRRFMQGPWQQLESLHVRPQQLKQLCGAACEDEAHTGA